MFFIVLHNTKGRLVLETSQRSHKQPENSGKTLCDFSGYWIKLIEEEKEKRKKKKWIFKATL